MMGLEDCKGRRTLLIRDHTRTHTHVPDIETNNCEILGLRTFLCSLAFLGLSGVWDPFAGAPAIGDAVCFSIVSAGIVETENLPTTRTKKSKSS